jgi:hypothetical protein
MKTYREVKTLLHAFLTSALGGGEWSISRPGHFGSGRSVEDNNHLFLPGIKPRFLCPPAHTFVVIPAVIVILVPASEYGYFVAS